MLRMIDINITHILFTYIPYFVLITIVLLGDDDVVPKTCDSNSELVRP